MLEVPVRELGVGVDLAVAEVPDEEVAAERAEARGREGDPPRGVELAVLRDAREQRTARVEDVDEAEALTVLLVVARLLSLRERHEDPVADGLDAERRVAVGQARVGERSG